MVKQKQKPHAAVMHQGMCQNGSPTHDDFTLTLYSPNSHTSPSQVKKYSNIKMLRGRCSFKYHAVNKHLKRE